MRNLILSLFIAFSISSILAQTSPALRKLQSANYAITSLYVDAVDENKITEDAIKGMLDKLDPHSSYLDAKEVKEMNEPLQGNFDGIGIQFNMLTDTLYVIQTIAGGPSEKVGLLAGDRIIQVDDTLIAGVKMASTDIMKRLKGPKGTTVRVHVLRKGVKDLIPFKIMRDKIPIYSVDAAFMADKTTGYIRVNRFGATTAQEFKDAVKKLTNQGMENLILDLEGNGGGYLNAAIEMADELLAENKMIVYTEGRRSPREEARSTRSGLFKEGRLVVMVDEYSASASEIVSGAIQDWDRGVIVGRRSFGKGLVQRPVPLPDGSMIRLTVARYYTPSGRSIQKPYEDTESYNKDLINRYNKGELSNADSIHFPDSLRFSTLLNKRIVYGGGGIMPDYFIPIDTTRFTPYHRKLVAMGTLNKFTQNYIDKHRKSLSSKYPTVDRFIAQYSVTSDMVRQLAQNGISDDILIDEEALQRSEPLLTLQIKALMARDLFDAEAYIRVINKENDSFNRALEIINDPKEYDRLLQNSK